MRTKKQSTTVDNSGLIRQVINTFGVKGAIRRISNFQSIEKRKRKLQRELDRLNKLV